MKDNITFWAVIVSINAFISLFVSFGVIDVNWFVLSLAMTISIAFGKHSIEKWNAEGEKEELLGDELLHVDGFFPTRKIINKHGLLAIDDHAEKIAIGNSSEGIMIYPYSSVLRCEIIEEAETEQKKSGSRMVKGAVVGGLIAGGAGSVIGGLSGSQLAEKRIKALDLKIVLKDVSHPSFKMRFFDSKKLSQKGISIDNEFFGKEVRQAIDNISLWRDLIDIIIDKNNAPKHPEHED